jgi:hypothetical protein
MTSTKKPARAKSYDGFTSEERAAMKDHAEELKTAARRGSAAARADGEGDVRAKIAEMNDADRAIAERVHALVTAAAPEITPRLWYGMPAYAIDGKLVCHFQAAQKFKTRYATLGFSDRATSTTVGCGRLATPCPGSPPLTRKGSARWFTRP